MDTFVHHSVLSTQEERETLEADVLFVGGGPASLAGAYHLAKLVENHNQQVDSSGQGGRLDPMIVLIEKGQELGAHGFSGAVINDRALRELIPDYEEQGCPIEADVESDAVYYLGPTKATKFPFVPSIMSNHGNKVISLARFNRWLGGLVEAAGVNIFPGFAGTDILEENSNVTGVRTGDKGIDASGARKGNFEPGIDLRANVTVFGDGPRGYLSKELVRRWGLQKGKATPVYETGVKEILEMPEGTTTPGRVIHTTGYPFGSDCIGGTWIYHMADNLISVGLVVPLDAKDPFIEQHRLFQQFKEHPFIKNMLGDGKPTQYGGKTISAGGYYSMPRLYTGGALLVGEAGSMVDMQRFKGVHLAIKSGMLAAEQILAALISGDFSEKALAPYQEKLRRSFVGESLFRVRHFHRAVSLGFPKAFFHIGLQQITGGRDLLSYDDIEEDGDTTQSVKAYHGKDLDPPAEPPYDGTYTLDKLSDVYLSGTQHDEDQPSHLKILRPEVCIEKCVDTYRYPCNRFCPAKVYEMLKDEDSGELRLQINFTNCVHCQTCDIKCPLNNIRWTPPEGGQGPNYTLL
ncbi:MAG: electron transfer flavoprotein-ubiquinone oxidoreductase [Candidatus Latescibacterota bacterium]|nr:MAG: electron transfer flavoprotein-ubiquinone oxidoreductase [Candidatus Latescibacterota bacterium]